MPYKILTKKEICPNQYEITIEAPFVVRNAKAGQFVILRPLENSERIPLTIADYDREKKTVTIIYQVVYSAFIDIFEPVSPSGTG